MIIGIIKESVNIFGKRKVIMGTPCPVVFETKNGKPTPEQEKLAGSFDPNKLVNKRNSDAAASAYWDMKDNVEPKYGKIKPICLRITKSNKICLMLGNDKIVKECQYMYGLCYKAINGKFEFLGSTKMDIEEYLSKFRRK